MKTILVTGSNGFIGRNLVAVLKQNSDLDVLEYDVNHSRQVLDNALKRAGVIFHLAGVNRPEKEEEFIEGNATFIEDICHGLQKLERKPKIVLSSSIQVEKDNPYGKSKLAGEQALVRYSANTGADVVIFRLKNVFGKWCKPNYNSVVATFCHNIARDIPITISDPANVIPLVYIDDVVEAFIGELDITKDSRALRYRELNKSYSVSLGELASLIASFRQSRTTLQIPAMNDELKSRLYSTYLSYLPTDDFSYSLKCNTDNRGSLAEFIKSPAIGQIFLSRTKPGITRGNHYHHTKIEKFFVVEGYGLIRFRHIEGGEVIEYRVNGDEYKVVDIPPGYTHSIENIGDKEMVVLFWAGELFNPDHPDTTFMPVIE